MNDVETIQFLWRYMVLADGEVLDAATRVSDEGWALEQGISFGSIQKLINHCIIAQHGWLKRLNGQEVQFFDVPPISKTDARTQWAEAHQLLLAFADVQTPETLQRTIQSTNRAGKRFELITWAAMLHVCDHATYHRGQINSMVKRAGGAPPPSMVLPIAVKMGFGKML